MHIGGQMGGGLKTFLSTNAIIPGGKMPPTRKVSIRLTERHYRKLELLVELGEFTSLSEAVREAVKLLLEKYKEQLESVAKLDNYR